MTTGAYISGAGHLLVILWILLGGVLFRAQAPEIMASADVTLLSEAEFAALDKTTAPETPSETVQPVVPRLGKPPEVSSAADAPVEASVVPEIAAPAEAESVPETPAPAPVTADVDAADPDQPVAPPKEVMAALVPPTPDAGTPAPLPRVAPMPRPEAPSKVEVAPEPVPVQLPTPVPEAAPEETKPQPEAAPEAASSEAAAETLTPKQAAPITAMRPPMRPKTVPRPEPKPEPKPEAPKVAERPEPAPDSRDAIAAAMQEATASDLAAPAALGGSLSASEFGGVRQTLESNWNNTTLDGSPAAEVMVVLRFSVRPDGVPDIGSIRVVETGGGDDQAIRTARETAERAIRMIAARGGFTLPRDKYSVWQTMEVTFGPLGELGI